VYENSKQNDYSWHPTDVASVLVHHPVYVLYINTV